MSTFSDGEIIEIRENVRGHDVFIIQPTCEPTHQLKELVLMVDALRRSSTNELLLWCLLRHARQDRRVRSVRVPISAKVVADMLSNAGVDRVPQADLHAEQIQGFFNLPWTISTAHLYY